MDLKQLQYFVEIVGAGGFNQAANRIRISQSALSRQIKLLEDELGAPVFERHSRGIHLTETGRLLSEKASQLLRQVATLRDELIERSEVPTGELHIGIPRSMRNFLTYPTALAFTEAYPNVFIRFIEDSSAYVRDRLLKGDVDIGLLSMHEMGSQIEAEPLVREQMFLVGPVSAGLRIDRPVTLEYVARQDLIAISRPASLRVALDKAMARAGLVPNIRHEINSTMTLSFVSKGRGYGVYSYCGAHEFVAAGEVSAAPIEAFEIEWLLVTNRDRPLSLATRIFRQMLIDTAAETIRSGRWPTAVMCQT